MPKRPRTPCNHPGCPELVEAGHSKCEKHRKEYTREQAREYDRGRPPSHKRGYDEHWRKLRKMVLAREPLCRRCKEAGRTKEANLIHHIDENPLNNFIENLEPLCATCHNREHGWK